MKKVLTGLFTIVAFHASWAQSWVGIDVGVNQSNVYYENSNGEQDKMIKGVPASYASLYYMHELGNTKKSKKLYDMPDYLLTVEIGYKRAQSRDSDSNLLNKWTMDYFSSSIGVRHIVSTKKKIAPFIGAAFSMDWLLSGVQQIGFEQYDLTTELSQLNLGIVGEGGLKYSINHDVLGTFGVSYTYGISDLEQNEQRSRLSGFKVGVGIHFLISK